MTKFSKISLDGVSENQVFRSDVAKTQQPGAEGLNWYFPKEAHQKFEGGEGGH